MGKLFLAIVFIACLPFIKLLMGLVAVPISLFLSILPFPLAVIVIILVLRRLAR